VLSGISVTKEKTGRLEAYGQKAYGNEIRKSL
jgi:hypothetical protein